MYKILEGEKHYECVVLAEEVFKVERRVEEG